MGSSPIVSTGSKLNATVKRDIKKNLKQSGFSKIPGVKQRFVNSTSAGAWILGAKGKQFVSPQIVSGGVTRQQLVKLLQLALQQL